MATNKMVQTHIDDEMNEDAAAVPATMELTISEPETIEAMEEARRGQLRSFDTVDELMDDLDAED